MAGNVVAIQGGGGFGSKNRLDPTTVKPVGVETTTPKVRRSNANSSGGSLPESAINGMLANAKKGFGSSNSNSATTPVPEAKKAAIKNRLAGFKGKKVR